MRRRERVDTRRYTDSRVVKLHPLTLDDKRISDSELCHGKEKGLPNHTRLVPRMEVEPIILTLKMYKCSIISPS